MFTLFLIIPLSLWHCCVYPANAQSAANLLIEKSYWCEEVPHPKIQLSLVPKTFTPGNQTFDITLITPIPIGNELRYGLTLEMEIKLAGKKQWQRLFYAEDDFCRIVQHYLGEMAYQLEAAMGILRGSCPIAQGRYHAVNYTLDFQRLKMQAFPFGKLRSITKILEKPKKNALHCMVTVITNTA